MKIALWLGSPQHEMLTIPFPILLVLPFSPTSNRFNFSCYVHSLAHFCSLLSIPLPLKSPCHSLLLVSQLLWAFHLDIYVCHLFLIITLVAKKTPWGLLFYPKAFSSPFLYQQISDLDQYTHSPLLVFSEPRFCPQSH